MILMMPLSSFSVHADRETYLRRDGYPNEVRARARG